MTQAQNQRDAADEVAIAKMQGVVAGVNADPTRKSERKSGLSRKGGGDAGEGGTQPTP